MKADVLLITVFFFILGPVNDRAWVKSEVLPITIVFGLGPVNDRAGVKA